MSKLFQIAVPPEHDLLGRRKALDEISDAAWKNWLSPAEISRFIDKIRIGDWPGDAAVAIAGHPFLTEKHQGDLIELAAKIPSLSRSVVITTLNESSRAVVLRALNENIVLTLTARTRIWGMEPSIEGVAPPTDVFRGMRYDWARAYAQSTTIPSVYAEALVKTELASPTPRKGVIHALLANSNISLQLKSRLRNELAKTDGMKTAKKSDEERTESLLKRRPDGLSEEDRLFLLSRSATTAKLHAIAGNPPAAVLDRAVKEYETEVLRAVVKLSHLSGAQLLALARCDNKAVRLSVLERTEVVSAIASIR